MQIGRFVLSLLFVLVTAVPSWTLETVRADTEATNRKANVSSDSSLQSSPTEAPGLTIAEALGLALAHNPALAAFDEEVRAKDAAAFQAGLLPNPELSVEIENFAGKDDLEGFDGAETSLGLSQLVELGGKRAKRKQLASLEKDLADWDYQQQKLEVLAAVSRDFVQLLFAQQQLQLSEELILLTEKTLEAVSSRVDAGKVPPLERVRSQVELAAARTERNKARHDLETARRRLAAHWNDSEANFAEVVGDLSHMERLGEKAALLELLPNNPTLARWDKELERQKVSYALARSQAVPDLTFSIGVKDFRENGSNALLAGIELPLPLFDRNQGGIREARSNLTKSRHEKRAAEIELRTQFAQAWQSLAAAFDEATALRDEILPGAQSAFESAEFGYREGKFDYLQLLDAQRTLFEIKGQLLQALAGYHQARTEVDRLTGVPLHGLLQPITE